MRITLRLGAALLLVLSSWELPAQGSALRPATVHLEIERKVGYLLGDLIAYDAVVDVDRTWRLRDSSLPTPGHSEYWLELRHVSVDHAGSGSRQSYRVHLLYQTFYAPIEARTRVIPGFPLLFEHDGRTSTLTVPSLTITMSPLREVVSGTGDPEENVKPNSDRAPALESLRPALFAVTLSLSVVLFGVLSLAWQRALWPFGTTVGRPFSQLRRTLSRTPGGDPGSYANALRALHRAFDATAGWRVFAEDQARFLGQWPRFRSAEEEISGFFTASRLFFFRNDFKRASGMFGVDRLRHLARRLATLERG